MRLTGTVFLIACCSIVGLPLFNGFVSEWLTFRSFLAASEVPNLSAAIVLPLAAGVLALIGGLAAACFAKVYGVAFLGRPRSREAGSANEVSLPMQAGMGVLATACVVIGIFPGLVLRSLGTLTAELLPGAALPPAATSLSGVLPWIALFVLVLVAGIAACQASEKADSDLGLRTTRPRRAHAIHLHRLFQAAAKSILAGVQGGSNARRCPCRPAIFSGIDLVPLGSHYLF